MNASESGGISATTPSQVRAARALLGWSRDRLSEIAGVPVRTLDRFEKGDGAPRQTTADTIRSALEAAGIEFIEQNGGGPGVRLKDRQP